MPRPKASTTSTTQGTNLTTHAKRGPKPGWRNRTATSTPTTASHVSLEKLFAQILPAAVVGQIVERIIEEPDGYQKLTEMIPTLQNRVESLANFAKSFRPQAMGARA